MAHRFLKRLLPFWAAGLIGTLAGASLTQLRDAAQLGQLLEQTHNQTVELNRITAENERLQEQIDTLTQQRQRPQLIQSVQLHVTGKEPPKLADVTEALEPLTTALVGLPIESASSDVLLHLFDNRVIGLPQGFYRIHVRVIIVAPTTQLMLELEKQTSAESNNPTLGASATDAAGE